LDYSTFNPVSKPFHYAHGQYECIDVMCDNFGNDVVMDFCICNAFKYLYRCMYKNGVEDLQKARWYIDKYLELYELNTENK
jgi:hypothetical protein